MTALRAIRRSGGGITRPLQAVLPAVLLAGLALCLLAAPGARAAPLSGPEALPPAMAAPEATCPEGFAGAAEGCTAAASALVAAQSGLAAGWADLATGLGTLLPARTDDLSASVAPIPLPAAGWLLVAGLGALGLFGRKRGDAPVPLRSALRDSARADGPVLRTARLFRGPATLDLMRRRRPPMAGRLSAFAPDCRDDAHPPGGAGCRSHAMAERAPPARASGRVTPGVATARPIGPMFPGPSLQDRPPGPAARPFVFSVAAAAPAAATPSHHQNGAEPRTRPHARRPHPVEGAAGVCFMNQD